MTVDRCLNFNTTAIYTELHRTSVIGHQTLSYVYNLFDIVSTKFVVVP